MVELLYSGECPYCRGIARFIDAIDIGGKVDTTPLESERGERLVTECHGEYIHAPHLFTEGRVYYGVSPTARGLAIEVPKEYLRSVRT